MTIRMVTAAGVQLWEVSLSLSLISLLPLMHGALVEMEELRGIAVTQEPAARAAVTEESVQIQVRGTAEAQDRLPSQIDFEFSG